MLKLFLPQMSSRGDPPSTEQQVLGSESGNSETKKVLGVGRQRKGGYVCAMCGKWFYRNAEMERHIRTHTGERPYKCSHCSYSAGRKSTLQQHVFNIHFKKPKTQLQ